MPQGNITRAECAQRAATVRIVGYEIHLDLSDARAELGQSTFRSTSRLTFTATASSTWVDLIADALVSATLNGVAVPVENFAEDRLHLDGLGPENLLEVVARCRYSNSGEGLHRFADPVDEQTYLYTQFAAAEARRVFACFEQPDMKAPFEVSVTAPSDWVVVANSPVATPGPEPVGGPPGESPGPQRAVTTWRFLATPPLATYVVAVIAGPYHRVQRTHAGRAGQIPMSLLIRASMAGHLDADEVFAITAAGLDHYERVFDMALPFAKYDQIFVPEFNLGAMENPGAVTFREDSFIFRSRAPRSSHELRAYVILHEMAHMWFGDLVTMAWWDDLWLNESFAEWAGHHAAVSATEFTDAWVTFALSGKARAVRADELPSTHPVAADMPDLESVYLNFDGITYDKGGSVLRQLVAWVGLDAFHAGVTQYFADHAWGNTTLADLLAALAQASGRDLQQWAQSWLQTVGVNTLRLATEVALGPGDSQAPYARVTLAQLPATAPAGVAPVLRPHRVALGRYDWQGSGADRRLVRRQRVELDVVGELVEVAELVGSPAAPLLLPNDDDLTFAKIRLDPTSAGTAIAHLAEVADPLARALLWGWAWDLVRDAELAASSYLELVGGQLAREANTSLLAAVYATVPVAFSDFLPTRLLPGAQLRLAATALAAAAAADPGSDTQLLHVRSFLRTARTAEQLDVLTELLEAAGHPALPGLRFDQELRWAAVTRLVAMGAATADLVAAESLRDPTMPGQAAAAMALAAQPSLAAKEDAWGAALLTAGVPEGHHDQPVLSNALLEATIRGFSYPEHQEFLAGFAPRYYEVVPRAWHNGGPNTAVTIARGLFPARVVTPQNLEAARGFASRPDLDPGLARVVAEGAEGLARAIRARNCTIAHPGS